MKELAHIEAVAIASSMVIDWNREHCIALFLDTKNHLLHSEIISIGTATDTLIHAREVFKPAIIHNAVKVMLLHNHPSGDIFPSKMDIAVTKRMADAGRLLQIELIDHLVFNKRGEFYSMSFHKKI